MPSDTELLIDAELGRVAVAVYVASEFRIWVIARELSRTRHGGSGWIDQAALWQALPSYGVTMTRRHYRRLLAAGAGVLWTMAADRLYLASIARLADELCIMAGLRNLEAVIATNTPGGYKSVWIPVSGTIEQFEANVYAGWLGAKADATIARQTLEGLWNRDATTLRRWEQKRLAGKVIVTPGYAITSDVEKLPSDGATWNKRAKQFVWQLPNTYRSTVRQTPRNGQRRKVKQAVDGSYIGAGADTHRTYFDTLSGLNRAIRRHPSDHKRYAFIGRWRSNNFFSPGADIIASL